MWEAYARLKPPPPSPEEEKWRREEEERRLLERSGRSLVPPPPAEVGMNLRDADTPALVMDLDALERNLQRLSYWCKNNKLRYRPCVSAHHCLHVASRQLELGASGVCCGGVLEAEVMVRLADVQDVLIVCPVVGQCKLRRLVCLAKEVYRLAVVMQDLTHAQALADLNWRGLYVYEGEELQRLHCPHTRRRLVLHHVVPLLRQCREALLDKELVAEMCEGGELTEVAPGSYATLDGGFVGSASLPKEPTFEHALFLLTTVQSVVCVGKPATKANNNNKANSRGRAGVVVDAGSEAISHSHTTALPPPSINRDASDCLPSYMPMGLHQGLLHLNRPMPSDGPSASASAVSSSSSATAPLDPHNNKPCGWLPPVGGKVLLVPGHSGATTALHDWVLGVRGHKVSDTLRLGTRGALL